MAYYNVCPYCKACLDPGEKCDCREPAKKRMEYFENHLEEIRETGQIAFKWYTDGVDGMKKDKDI